MRLVTRSDLDGLTSAVLIGTMEDIETIELIHPQDITDNKFEITKNDVMSNLPYHPKAAMWFDHHLLTDSNKKPPANVKGGHSLAPSAARVVYDYYHSDKLKKHEHLVRETDRLDSAQLTMEDVIRPKGVILLGFTIDGRTGIQQFEEYFNNLVRWLQTLPVEDVMKKPDVVVRARFLKDENANFLKVLRETSRLDEKIVITDFRPLAEIPVGNRFLVYTLYPEANISVRLQWGPRKEFVVTTLGHSIFDRTSQASCGEICSRFGGGGHRGAAAAPIRGDDVEDQIARIIQMIKEAGSERV